MCSFNISLIISFQIITFIFLLSFLFFLFLSVLYSYYTYSFRLFIYKVSYIQKFFPAFSLLRSPMTKQSFYSFTTTVPKLPFSRSAYFYYEDEDTFLLRNTDTYLSN